MRRFLLPSSKNNYTPLLLHRSALVIYVVVIFLFNIVVGQLQISSVYADVDASALYGLHNSTRSSNGLPTLSINQQLVTSATNKAKAMLDSDCWDHYCPPGTSPWSFILNTGYEYVYAGENLGEGFTNSSTLMNAWMNSATHRANILNSNFIEIGIGFASGPFQGNTNNTVVVVHFGARQKVAPTASPKPLQQVSVNTNQNTTTPTSKPILPTPTRQILPTSVPSVIIESPLDGSVLNNSQPEIKGQKPETSTLDIVINDKSLGKVDAKGSNFSFRPSIALVEGEQNLKTVTYINNKLVTESETISFTIDTTPPVIEEESLKVSYKNDTEKDIISITLKTMSDSIKVSTNVENNGFAKLDSGEWILEIGKESIPGNAIIAITSEDKAGNKSILEIPGEEILGYFDHNLFLTEDMGENIVTKSSPFSSSLLSNIKGGGLRSQVNFIFILFLCALCMLDFYVIHKSGLTGISRSKSHLHLSAGIILLFVFLLGGLGGKII